MDDALQQAWHGVTALAARPEASAIRPLFAADPQRFARYSHRGGGLFLDMSKTAITDAARTALLGVARAARVAERRDAMVRGDLLNVTERRAALHMALRGRVAAAEASDDAARTLSYMRAFTESVHRGEVRGATNQRFDTVLNIGIGGSDLGPTMVSRALWRAGDPMRPIHLGNVDGMAGKPCCRCWMRGAPSSSFPPRPSPPPRRWPMPGW
jgi:glucose-6-phosphate isomerase